VALGDEGVFRELELAHAAHQMLVGLEVIAQAVHPLTADQDQPRLGRVLHVAEVVALEMGRVFRDRRPTATAELVARGNGRHARFANVPSGLIHQLLLVRRLLQGAPGA
jgi:hypothetical protein